MTARKIYTFRLNDATPDDHIGRVGEITYRDGYLYYHDGATAGGELINGGGGSGGTTTWATLSGKPSFAAVATSGSYADLTGKPSIPTVPTNEITNTDGISTWSVSVGTDGVITMNTVRGGIEFGALPEPGGPNHLHIMRPAGQNGATDLYFGDDYNYVKMPGLYGSNPNHQQGVEIGSSINEGTVSVWKFGTDGTTTLPGNLVIAGNTSVFGTNAALIQPANDLPLIALSSGANGAVSSIWIEDIGNVGTSNIAAVYANPIPGSGIVRIAVGSNSSNVYLWDFGTDGELSLPTNGYTEAVIKELDATALVLFAQSTGGNIKLLAGSTSAGGAKQWLFNGTTGNLTLPAGGDIVDSNGTTVLGGGSTLPANASGYLVNDGAGTLSWAAGDGTFSGNYNDLTNKPTIRIAVATGSGPGGNLQADSLALAGLNPATDIASTWGGDLILQGGVGGANSDLYGEVRIKSGQIGANYEWHFTTDRKIKLPAGGSIVDSSGATAFVSLATLKQVVAASTDFADFQTRIAGML